MWRFSRETVPQERYALKQCGGRLIRVPLSGLRAELEMEMRRQELEDRQDRLRRASGDGGAAS